MTSDDMTLVREYTQSGSEQAFATLVSRHINLVYSVALRQLGDTHLAEEASQTVFITLARKAGSLSPETILPGWLCRTARYVSADTLRTQRRRHSREQEAHMQSLLNKPDSTAWNQIAPLLDEALNSLRPKEHDAVVLRFFDDKDLKQVGAAMGTTEDAARMRVNRGLEKIRDFFSSRGVAVSATAIAGAIAANSVQAAPSGLAGTVTTAALSGTTITAAALVATKAVSMTSLQKTLAIAGIAILSAATAYQTHRVAALRHEAEMLPKAAASESSSDLTAAALTRLREENAQLQTNQAELLRARGEVALLHRENQELARSRQDLRQMLDALYRSNRPASTNAITFGNPYMRREEWQNKGNSDPHEAVVTLLSMLRDNDLDSAKRLIVPSDDPQNARNILINKNYWDRTTGLQIVDINIIRNGDSAPRAIIGSVMEQQTDRGATQRVRSWFLIETNGTWMFTGGFAPSSGS